MALSTGTRLGPYEITGALGAGGMGEVYRARDTRLDRTVAVKVLPHRLSSDPDLRQRFEREAKAISALQHPNICVLHDIGRQEGVDYLVMEYLEGETLASRLERGTLPLAEALKIGAEVAQALDKAHSHGIVHRDLKPGNIMLTRTGAKLMDFGLAKPVRPAVGAVSTSQEATRSRGPDPITAEGAVVGTFQYMAPEVIEGAEADARSDLFGLGCVLYEMVTGRRAFEGKSATSVFAAILEREPEPIARLVPVAPPALDRIVHACLAKQPHLRWQSAHDLALELRWLAESREAPAGVSPVRRWMPWAVAALAVLLAVFLVMSRMERGSAPSQFVRSSLLPPPGYSFDPYGFALSPDGGRLAFVAEGQDGRASLWVRSLSSPTAQPLSGTEDAVYPFWSPDGRSIAFFAQGKLKALDTATGETRVVCSSFALVGGTWNADNTIVFAPGVTGVLARVSVGGGAPEPVTRLPREGSGQAHRWPFFLPDGKHFLYVADWSSPEDPHGNGLYVGSLDGGEGKLISADISGNAEYANGYLFYFRDLSLAAQPFDLGRLALSGAPIIIGEQGVERNTAFSKAGYSVSRNGTLVYQSAAESPARLVWFDPSGRELEQVRESGNRDPRFSPDGRFLAVTADEAGNGQHNIRIYDLARHVSTGITSGGGDNEFPVWSPDQRSIYYASRRGNLFAIERIAADGSGQPEVWLQGGKMLPNDISSDGHYMVIMALGLGGAVVETYTLPDKQRIGQVRGAEARVSHDGRWLSYTAPDGELYAQSFPRAGARIQISNGGGAQPHWSSDDRTLTYITQDKKLMKVRFDPTGKQPPGAPEVVMQTRIVGARFSYIQYDVTPDGQRILIDSLPAAGGGPLALITNWSAAAPAAR